MKVLVLGGTNFVGRHVTNELIARGHHVTLLSRGQSNPSAFADSGSVKKVQGDRYVHRRFYTPLLR